MRPRNPGFKPDSLSYDGGTAFSGRNLEQVIASLSALVVPSIKWVC